MSRYQKNLQPYKRNFLLTTALFLIVSTAFSLQERERRILEKKQKELVQAKEGLSRIRTAIQGHHNALATLRSQFTEDAATTTPARQIYSQVDLIKAQHKPDEMVIGAIEKNGTDISLKYTLNFRDADYSALLNTMSRLQQNVFPFTPVESVSISQGENQGKGFVLTVISGRIISIESMKQ